MTGLEGLNARELGPRHLGGKAIGAVVSDVSFISLRLALPPALSLAAPGAFAVLLVKPQFEAGRAAIGKGGLLRDPSKAGEIAADLSAWLDAVPRLAKPRHNPLADRRRRRKRRVPARRGQGMSAETVRIGSLGAQGDGVAETEAGPVHVPFALPGESVTIARQKSRGTLMAVKESAGERVAPPCPHFGPDGRGGACGGCNLQHMALPAYESVETRPRRARARRAAHRHGCGAAPPMPDRGTTADGDDGAADGKRPAARFQPGPEPSHRRDRRLPGGRSPHRRRARRAETGRRRRLCDGKALPPHGSFQRHRPRRRRRIPRGASPSASVGTPSTPFWPSARSPVSPWTERC